MTRNQEIIIGLTGLKASGKDVFCERLEPLGFVTRRCSDEIRDEWSRRGVASPTVEQLIQLGNEGRETSGDVGYWARQVLAALRAAGRDLAIINGLRHPDEVDALMRDTGGRLVLVGVVAPLETRAARFLKRARLGDPTEYAGFLRLDDADRGVGQPPHGQQVDRTLARVPWENLYNNAGSLDDFHAWIDDFIRRLGLLAP